MSAAYNIQDQNASSNAFDPARQHFDDIIEGLSGATKIFSLDSDDLEQHIATEVRELARLMLQGHYDLRAPARPVEEVVGVEGITRTYSRSEQGRGQNSRFGPIRIRRVAYCSEQAVQLCPLDAALNLAPQKLSRNVQKMVCEQVRHVAFEHAQETLEQWTGLKIGNRQLEETAVHVAQDFESFYEQRQAPNSGDIDNPLVITVDCKGVRMIERDLREVTRKRAEEARKTGTRDKRRLAPGQKRDRKRMATVASVYEHLPNPRTAQQILSGNKVKTRRETIKNKRVWADLERSMSEVVGQAFDEARARDPQGERQWVVLVDGDPHLMDAVLDEIEEVVPQGICVWVIVDFIHVSEYLWKAANALYGAQSKAGSTWVSEQMLRLLSGEARTIVHGMRVSAGKRDLSENQRETVRKSASYIEKRYDYLHYDEAIERGIAIATGVIEGACRHLVNDRLGITGARWSLARGQAILQLRALSSSGDWEEYWQWHKKKSYEREHAACYAGGRPPRPIYTASGQHLSPI